MKIKIECKDENFDAADHFLTWLCESGEQHYWDWMEVRESEQEPEDPPITVVSFKYDFKNLTVDCEIGKLEKVT